MTIESDLKIADSFWQNCLKYPTAPALVDHVATDRNAAPVSMNYTWEELGKRVCRAVSLLENRGIASGDHVASWMPNGVEWIVLDMACSTIGAVHVATDFREPFDRAERLAEFADAKLLFVRPGTIPSSNTKLNLSSVDRLLDDPSVDGPDVCEPTAEEFQVMVATSDAVAATDAAQMLFTSGTVNKPKGVLLSHNNLASNARAKLDAAPQTSDDVRLNVLPFSHAYARTCELSTWIIARGKLVITRSWREFVRVAPIVRPTLVNLVPHLAMRLADLISADCSSVGGRLRLLQVGGAALTDALWQKLDRRGLPPLQGYGLTETSPVVCSNRSGSQRPGTVGPPVSGVDIRVADDGELLVRGPNVMLGYWKNVEATRSVYSGDWLATGDLVARNGDGSLRVLGRKDQQIVLSTGYKVNPSEVEDLLTSHPDIDQAVVLGTGMRGIVALVYSPISDVHFWPLAPVATSQLQSASPILKAFEECVSGLPGHMVPHAVARLAQPFSRETQALTAKGTVKRAQVAQQYRGLVRKLRDLMESRSSG